MWFVAFGQPDTLWTQHLQIGYSVSLYRAVELAEGGFAVAGSCSRDGATLDWFVARLSENGDVTWSRAFGTTEQSEQANSIVQTADGNLMLIGQSAAVSASSRTLALMGVSIAGDSLWTRSYSASQGLRKGMDGAALPDGNVMLVGYKLGTDQAHSDMWLLKVSAIGDTLWTRLYGGNDTDTGSRILAPGTGTNVYLAGQTKSNGSGDYDFWLLQTDSSGQQIADHPYGTPFIEKCFDIALGNSHLYLAGRTQDSRSDAYLVKVSSNYVAEWSRAYDNGGDEEQISGVADRPGGGAVCVGWTGASTTSTLPWLFRVNRHGTLEQSWTLSTVQSGQFAGILPITHGGYLAWGTITAAGNNEGYVVKYAPTGELCGFVNAEDTQQPIGGVHVSLADGSVMAVTDSLGHYSLDLVPGTHDVSAWGPCISRRTLSNVIVGQDSSTNTDFEVGSPQFECRQTSINMIVRNHIPNQAPLAVYNTGEGELELNLTVEMQQPNSNWLAVEPLHSVIPSGDSLILNVRVSADTTDNGIFEYYGFVVVHTSACPDSIARVPVWVSVLDAPGTPRTTAHAFALEPAYPNPFNPQTTLSYSVPRDTHVRLAVYDVTGRTVAMLSDGWQSAGTHQVRFDGTGFASGIYFVRMETSDFSAMEKLMLLK
jgi:hypothetical protein